MELANRLDLESKLAAKLSRLYGSHRRRITAALKQTGDPPDAAKIPASLWSEIENEIREQLSEELLLIFLLVVAASSNDLGLGLKASTASRMGEAYSGGRAREIAQKMMEHSRNRLLAGSTPLEVFSPERAATVARTEVGAAQSSGSIDAVKSPLGDADRAEAETADEIEELEIEEKPGKPEVKTKPGKKRLPDDQEDDQEDTGQGGEGGKKPKRRTLVAYWRHSTLRPKGHAGAAEKPCPICTPRLNKPESQWGGLVPGQAHPHCILPGNLIRAFGEITAATKSFYDGICVELRLDCGTRLTCTANHPILTSAGWKAANLIQKGSNIFRTSDREWKSGVIDPDANQVPTLVEKIFASLKMNPGMLSSSVPSAAEQFHGDGKFLKGKVEIVYRNSFLANWTIPKGNNHIEKSVFDFGVTGSRSLSGFSPNYVGRLFAGLSTNSSMGGGGLLKSFFPGHFAGTDNSCLAARTDFDIGIDQVFSKRCPGNPQRIGNGIFRFPGLVTGNDFRRNLNFPGFTSMPNANAILRKPSTKDAQVYADRMRNFLDRFSGLVSTKQVTDVRRFRYRGHVYDLHVEGSHMYSASNIAVSNCDCYVEWVALNDSTLPGSN